MTACSSSFNYICLGCLTSTSHTHTLKGIGNNTIDETSLPLKPGYRFKTLSHRRFENKRIAGCFITSNSKLHVIIVRMCL